MSTVPNQGGTSAKESGSTSCQHTTQHQSTSGVFLGTWIEVKVAEGSRVVCSVCGKLFEQIKSDEEILAAYLEQQLRLACPGCGESPFLG